MVIKIAFAELFVEHLFGFVVIRHRNISGGFLQAQKSYVVILGNPIVNMALRGIRHFCLNKISPYARQNYGQNVYAALAIHYFYGVLPSMYIIKCGQRKAILQQAYELLVSGYAQETYLDEVCYRLMMQLREHSRLLLAANCSY
ncbi:hypothetical protein NQ317_008266 [Molorchus minor]|uniref:Uncharacterized protein n=1 Tax=Molorchus minor TaxID=1323400 RepID=A0ABQ9J9D9_9CUCU|nr:hypothetical protein NQ317_008266 [Molorchus minor]